MSTFAGWKRGISSLKRDYTYPREQFDRAVFRDVVYRIPHSKCMGCIAGRSTSYELSVWLFTWNRCARNRFTPLIVVEQARTRITASFTSVWCEIEDKGVWELKRTIPTNGHFHFKPKCIKTSIFLFPSSLSKNILIMKKKNNCAMKLLLWLIKKIVYCTSSGLTQHVAHGTWVQQVHKKKYQHILARKQWTLDHRNGGTTDGIVAWWAVNVLEWFIITHFFSVVSVFSR